MFTYTKKCVKIMISQETITEQQIKNGNSIDNYFHNVKEYLLSQQGIDSLKVE